jgi:flagella basal body P-ring formation protein FlgA
MNIYPVTKQNSKLEDKLSRPLLWLFFLLCFNPTIASEIQHHDEIHSAIKEFAGDVTIQEIDPRLRLEPCTGNLSVRYPFSTETTVEVKCTADKGWKIFLTVEKVKPPFIPQNHNEIYDQILRFAGDVHIEKISPHLIYEKCSSAIRISYPFNDQKTVKAECFQPSQWEVFIPISYPEKNSVPIPLAMGVIATRTLLRGIPIIASDIELKAFPDNRLKSGHVKSLKYPIGMEPSQTISKGALISINMLRPPVLVRKGDAVSIIFERNGISVTNEGIALENGGLREKIKIQLPDTKKILSATIQSAGVVKIP